MDIECGAVQGVSPKVQPPQVGEPGEGRHVRDLVLPKVQRGQARRELKSLLAVIFGKRLHSLTLRQIPSGKQ